MRADLHDVMRAQHSMRIEASQETLGLYTIESSSVGAKAAVRSHPELIRLGQHGPIAISSVEFY